jgi:hypothetical protein
MGHKMLSDNFVNQFRGMMARHQRHGTFYASDQAGARDAMPSFTPATKAMSNTRDAKRSARDQEQWRNPNDNAPAEEDKLALDPATVKALVDHIRSEWGEDALDDFLEKFNQRFPNAYKGTESPEEEAEEEELENETGTGRFADDREQVGGPSPFRGMPERGGSMTGDAAGFGFGLDANRIQVLPDYGPSDSKCPYDIFGRRVGDGYISKSEKRQRREAHLAMDSAKVRSYDSVWGDLTNRIKLL